jgi:hypothetical protein
MCAVFWQLGGTVNFFRVHERTLPVTVDAGGVLEALVPVNTLPGKEAPVLSFREIQQLSVLQVRCLSSHQMGHFHLENRTQR